MAHREDIKKYPKCFGHQLPEYFTIAEFEYSETAIKLGIDNTLTNTEHYENARQFMLQILDPLRKAWTEYCIDKNLGRAAIRINSGYRTKELNDAINGSKTSAHCIGCAADIEPANNQMKHFQKFVDRWLTDNNIEFDQFIIEKPKNGVASWIHIGWKNRNGEQRKQKFTLV